MSSDLIIQVDNVHKTYKMYEKPIHRLYDLFTKKKRYKEVKSLKGVSLQVRKGETMGIIGRNGAGKSTLLQMIAGTLSPTMGKIEVNGRVVAMLELGAGFNMEFTGEENVYLYGSILGLSREEIRSRYASILEFAEIGEFIDYPVKTYSSGMFVRLAFSVAINVDPKVLIIDEALSVGDLQFQHKCIAKLKALQSSGCTILFVSHDIDSVKSLCNSAILLNEGKIALSGLPEEVAKEYFKLIHMEQQDKRQNKQVLSNESGSDRTAASESWDTDTFENSDRHGSGEAKIANIQFRDYEQRIANAISFGKGFTIDVKIEYKQRVESYINVGILFRDDKGIDILGDDSWNHNQLLPPGNAGDRFILKFEFEHLYIKPSSYSLTVALGAMSDDRTTWNDYYFDWIERAKILVVRQTDDLRVWSKVHLPATVEIDRLT